MASPKCYSSILEPLFWIPYVPPTPATPGGGWRHHPASSFEQMSRSHICDEAPESREGRCVEPSVPRAEVTQAVPSLSTAGSFLQPDTLSCMSASPSPTSLPLRHSHLCLPFTHISASLLPASCRSSLGILHELCDGHCVTSTAPPRPPQSPSAPVPSSQMAAPDPTQWQPGPEEGILLPCLRFLH